MKFAPTDRTQVAEAHRLMLKTYPNAQTIRESKFRMQNCVATVVKAFVYIPKTTDSNTVDLSTYPQSVLYNKTNLQLISGRVSDDTDHMDVMYYCRLVPRIVHSHVNAVHRAISVA